MRPKAQTGARTYPTSSHLPSSRHVDSNRTRDRDTLCTRTPRRHPTVKGLSVPTSSSWAEAVDIPRRLPVQHVDTAGLCCRRRKRSALEFGLEPAAQVVAASLLTEARQAIALARLAVLVAISGRRAVELDAARRRDPETARNILLF